MVDIKKIALERIAILFDEAEKAFKLHPERSDRYIEIAKKIGMKAKVKIPPILKRKFCKHCDSYLRPGVNCRVRNHKGRMIYQCSNCKKFMRFVLRKARNQREAHQRRRA